MLFDRRAPAPEASRAHEEPLRPERPFVAIGDVHGRADLLHEIDRLIATRCAAWPVVFLGDYVDRGENSRDALNLLMSVPPDRDPPVTCLMGNHEHMLLDFLDSPGEAGPRWLRNGGLQTLAALRDLRDRLADTMGADMIAWLRARPLTWHSGNVWAVHAGADPDLPMAEQAAGTLLWGHPAFHRQQRTDGQWVVHGHTVVTEPQVRAGRIAVDTGAYATGCLSAALVTRDGVSFLQTGRD
jgi:serine/threonine protein phosphatase 1